MTKTKQFLPNTTDSTGCLPEGGGLGPVIHYFSLAWGSRAVQCGGAVSAV